MSPRHQNVTCGIVATLRESYRAFLDDAEGFFGAFDFLGQQAARVGELKSEIGRPFNIAFFGRMKAGKSSIVNALLGKDLAVTGVEETTATINVISRAKSPEQCLTFVVHWKDRSTDEYPLSCLNSDWSGKDETVMERVAKTAFIQLFSDDPALALNEIIDTPGTGAVVAEHERVAQDFLDPSIQEGRKADALVYVFGVNGRETDSDALESFREGTLAHSYPYNSVGVLHKWDLTYWNSNGDWGEILGKCAKLKSQLGTVVADVIPISAPLARVSARADDATLEEVLNLVDSLGDGKIEELLDDDEDWDDDQVRHRIRKTFDIPWICFKVAVREALRLEHKTAPLFRARLAELGGLDRLKRFLDKNFYKDSEIIRQQNQYRKFLALQREAQALVEDKLDKLGVAIGHWDTLFERQLKPRSLESWIEAERANAIAERNRLKTASLEFDSAFRNSPVVEVLKDVDALNWCRQHTSEICEDDAFLIRRIMEQLAGNAECKATLSDMHRIKLRLQALALVAKASDKAVLRHMTRRIDALVRMSGL